VGALDIGDRIRIEIEGIGFLENVVGTRSPIKQAQLQD
jgi:hypothetical protein